MRLRQQEIQNHGSDVSFVIDVNEVRIYFKFTSNTNNSQQRVQ